MIKALQDSRRGFGGGGVGGTWHEYEAYGVPVQLPLLASVGSIDLGFMHTAVQGRLATHALHLVTLSPAANGHDL